MRMEEFEMLLQGDTQDTIEYNGQKPAQSLSHLWWFCLISLQVFSMDPYTAVSIAFWSHARLAAKNLQTKTPQILH